MVDYGRIRSTVRPEPIVIDEYSVWKHTDVQIVSENVGMENEFVGFEYHMVQYSKDEFILQQATKNEELVKIVREIREKEELNGNDSSGTE